MMQARKVSSGLLESVRNLAPQIETAADEIERERRLPAVLVRALASAGLFNMVVPRGLGGGEATMAEYTEALEEVAKHDASTAWCLGQNTGITWIAAHLPEGTAREIFQPDARFAWGQGTSRAVRTKGGYVVNGEWRFASGIRHATWLGAHNSPLLHDDGSPELDHHGRPIRVTLMFPAERAEIIDVWDVSGLRGTASDTYRVRDLFIEERFLVLDEPQHPGPLYIFGTTNVFQAGFASVALGIARAMLDAIVEMSVTKTPRGMSGPLRDQPYFQQQLGEAEATWRSARALLRRTIDEVWYEASVNRRFEMHQRVDLRLAATHAIRSSAAVVDSVYYLAGGNAIFASNPFERRFRDMHAVTQQVQGRQDHYTSAGRFMLGLEPDIQFL